ncbi:malate dehydrogenase [Anaeramoeba ignava]|uniref:malate dehydrogenase n=1 Tax=Anaeramoeba ignava TaxID=1746090 RepID=A0A9Q0LPC3_ANAIG|nr:malate dehydrogenase [Anaeramoeba ignava]|eukprot:Anaeramoba_ignava/a480940_39.p1 GENE.a480940_39~~a480940_39.p1  ORF type:complete len:336 (-),score=111.34 a480940_39:174-1181(-)
MNSPIRVCITGAAGQIAYSLIFKVANGEVFGIDQPLILQLLDITPMMGVLAGVEMEIRDCAFPLVQKIICTDDPTVAFEETDYAFLVGARPRSQGMERKDLLKANAQIFKQQGEAIDKKAKKTIKVLVVGNPANTNCLICQTCAPSIPPENFTSMSRLDHNRMISQLSERLNVNNDQIFNVIAWGNHSSTQYPDVSHAYVKKSSGEIQKIKEAVNDDNWIQNDFLVKNQQRGAEVIKARKLSSAASAAKAACDHMHDWVQGTSKDKKTWVSMSVLSDGSYGITKGIFYSFPVTCEDGKYSIVKGLEIDEFSRTKMDLTLKELTEEKEEAFTFLKI